jgi:hypothetical protein
VISPLGLLFLTGTEMYLWSIYFVEASDLSHFSKMAWKKFAEKTKNHLRNNNHEVCAAVARCFRNILDVIVLENINLSSDKIGPLPLWSNETDLDFCHQSLIYAVSSVYFNHTLILYMYVHWTWKCLISVRKWHGLPFTLCYELNSVHVNLLILKGDA